MTTRRGPRTGAVAPAIVLIASLAFALPARADSEIEPQPLKLFEEGRAAYKAGRFQEAIDLLQKAYQLEPAPVLLYNLAKAYEGLGDIENAAKSYAQYLTDEKDIPDRAVIEEKVRNFKKTIAEKARLAKERDDALAKLQKKDVPKDEPPPLRAPSPAPWIFVGVGGAGLVLGGVLGGLALGKNADADVAPSQKEAAEAHDSATSLAVGSTVGFIAGGALAGGGLVWGIVDLVTRGPATKPAASPGDVTLDVGPGSILVRGHF